MSQNYEIHPLAHVSPKAEISAGVQIGPYCLIGPHVKIGPGCKLHSHVVLEGHLTLGNNNEIFPFSTIGLAPQDLSYKNEPTQVVIGNNNVIREHVSIHRGTMKQKGLTQIGDHCLFMAYAHLGHDVTVGNKVIIVNAVNLAGHVTVGDNSIISGGTNIAQFVTLGRGSYIGGASAVDRDIPHFCTAYGNRIRMKGINIIGMRRQGIEKKIISEVVDFYRGMESSSLSPRAFVDHPELMDEYAANPVAMEIASFIRISEIGIAPFMT